MFKNISFEKKFLVFWKYVQMHQNTLLTTPDGKKYLFWQKVSGGLEVCANASKHVFDQSRRKKDGWILPLPEGRRSILVQHPRQYFWVQQRKLERFKNKVLGMAWDANTDLITYNAKYKNADQFIEAMSLKKVSKGDWTKRLILRLSATVYDPLGLISPVTTESSTGPMQPPSCKTWLNWSKLRCSL